jgi:hypothetical protein
MDGGRGNKDSDCAVPAGPIAFRAEGGKIHFPKMELMEIE